MIKTIKRRLMSVKLNNDKDLNDKDLPQITAFNCKILGTKNHFGSVRLKRDAVMHLCFMDSEKNQTPFTRRHCTQHSNHLKTVDLFLFYATHPPQYQQQLLKNRVQSRPKFHLQLQIVQLRCRQRLKEHVNLVFN